MIDIDKVDIASLVIEGLSHYDHPDYCDAFYSSGHYVDGTPLTDDELEELKDMDSNLFYELINNTIY